MSGTHLSKEFFELIKNIGESKSKQEEDRIMRNEVSLLKSKLDSKKNGGTPVVLSKKKQKEFLVRLMYVEMLGHDGSFGYIKAVEMVASPIIAHKRLGYLVCGACLPPEHEFRFMLINQLQRDLQSSHVLETACALIALSYLATVDMIAAVSNFVILALDHGSDMIRKKAIHALHKCYEMDSSVVTKDELVAKLRKILCDRDPGVMGASLGIIESLAKSNPTPFKDLVPSLVSILKQIIEHRLPREYDYHRMPAPWMQMSLLRILRILGKADIQASQGMYEIIGDCMKRADIGVNAGYAVVYECIRTITNIYPNVVLLDAAADAISRFISSRNHNLKYLGVTGLAAIVESHPKYATVHQLSVMDCLESPDITLAHRTLELLYRMTNPHNVEFIIEKLLEFLRGGKEFHSDEHLQRNLTFKIANLAERFAPSNEWYVETITQLLEISGNVPSCKSGLIKVGNQLMQLIAEGEGGGDDEDEFDDSADISLRRSTVNTYISILLSSSKTNILQYPDVFIQIMSWILGEYGYLADKMSVEAILEKVCQLILKKDSSTIGDLEMSATTMITTRYLFNAIFKLIAQAGTCPPVASQLIRKYKSSHDVELQQRCVEFEMLLLVGSNVMGDVLPIDASCEDLGDDVELSFLDSYVNDKINDGAQPYAPPEGMDDDEMLHDTSSKPVFNMTPYAKPSSQQSNASSTLASRVYNPDSGNASSATVPSRDYPSHVQQQTSVISNGPLTLNLRNAANVWGKQSSAPTPPNVTNTNESNYSANTSNLANTSMQMSQIQQGSVGVTYEPEKSKELTEREKMASALFGGVGGAPSASARVRSSKAKATTASSTLSKVAPTSPKPTATAEIEEPVIDLLDMSSFGTDLPSTAPAAMDVLTPTDLPSSGPTTFLAESKTIENCETLEDSPKLETLVSTSATAPSIDPFAAEGLLGDIQNKPLAGFGSTSSDRNVANTKFTYNGNTVSPLTCTTLEFGQQWGSIPFTSTCSLFVKDDVSDLNQFMKYMEHVAGFHPVEAIGATSEGICAGSVGAVSVLLHGKVSKVQEGAMARTKVDLTIKATDMNIGDPLVLYFSKLLK